MMHGYLIEIGNLLSKVKKSKRKQSKTEVQPMNSEANAETVETIPEIEVLDFPEYQDPVSIDSMIRLMSKKSWMLIVPSEASLKKIAEKSGLVFHTYIYRNSRGIGNLSSARYVSLHNVVPDGNCGYRALSYGITGSENNHIKLREKICDFILDTNIPCFQNMFPEGKAEAKSKKNPPPGVAALPCRYWMTTIDLFAASIMLEINILVRDPRHDWQLYNSSIQNGFSNMQVDLSLPTILMDNSSKDHFQAITDVRRF